MIAGIFHQGSGLGDQLHRYVTVRTLAIDKNFDFGAISPQNFKGKDFMVLDFGKDVSAKFINEVSYWKEKEIRENDIDIRSYDPEINFVEDNTIIDGCFEDEKYWGHRLPEIREWLKVEPLNMPDDLCVMGFRGGEYATIPDLFLTKGYWEDAIAEMKKRYSGIRFEVHTDDPIRAKEFFPDFPIFVGIDINWRSVRYAKHLIVANSAFYIMPMLLGEAKDIICPRYWARRNLRIWARPACYYKDKRITYL